MPSRPLKVFPSTGSGQRLCHAHIIPLWNGFSVRVPQGDDIRDLHARLTTPPLRFGAGEDGVDAWLDKANPCGERSRTTLPGQDWELEIRKAVRETIDV